MDNYCFDIPPEVRLFQDSPYFVFGDLIEWVYVLLNSPLEQERGLRDD